MMTVLVHCPKASACRGLRLSHGLMKLEEEQAKLEAATQSRRDEFQSVWAALKASSEKLGDALDADCAEVGRADLTKARLLRFRKALEASTQLEAERRNRLESLQKSTTALEKELDDASDAPVVEGAELASARIDQAQARLQSSKTRRPRASPSSPRWARTFLGCGSGWASTRRGRSSSGTP